MREQHRRTIDRLLPHFQADPACLALLVGGSIARGWERDDSDVDILIVVSDEDYTLRLQENRLHFFSMEFSDYPGGYVDGKFLSRGFLEEAADHGSEPARAAFQGVLPVWSRFPGLEELLARIPVYPEAQRGERLQSFLAQVLAMQWYVGEAEKRGDPYLLAKMSADLVLYGGRLILAYNRILFPFHKWFLTELRNAPEKPEGLVELAEELAAHPSKAGADRFTQCLLDFHAWELPPEGWPTRFMQDTEWTWRHGWALIGEC
jgi:hypothetical protein